MIRNIKKPTLNAYIYWRIIILFFLEWKIRVNTGRLPIFVGSCTKIISCSMTDSVSHRLLSHSLFSIGWMCCPSRYLIGDWRSFKCNGITAGVAFSPFQWLQQNLAIFGIIKQLHYQPSCWILTFSRRCWRRANGNKKPANVKTVCHSKKHDW